MANANRGLGRGLGALLGDAALQTESADSLYLPISQVESCAGQPRKHFDDAALADLADSIREHGIIQPLTVRKLASGYYQIIAGERRWRAARLAGLTQVPAIVIEADDRIVVDFDNEIVYNIFELVSRGDRYGLHGRACRHCSGTWRHH